MTPNQPKNHLNTAHSTLHTAHTARVPRKSSRRTPAQRTENIMLLESEFTKILREFCGEDDRAAVEKAKNLVKGLCITFHAQKLYIPAPSISERNAAIRREFTGSNAAEIVERFKVSRSLIYQIVSQPRERQASPPVPQKSSFGLQS